MKHEVSTNHKKKTETQNDSWMNVDNLFRKVNYAPSKFEAWLKKGVDCTKYNKFKWP